MECLEVHSAFLEKSGELQWNIRHWPTAVKAIRAFGARINEAALPELVMDQAGDYNAPGRDEAPFALLEMDQERVITQLISLLLDQGKTIRCWDYVAEGLCDMLKRVGGTYALQCVPNIALSLDPTLCSRF